MNWTLLANQDHRTRCKFRKCLYRNDMLSFLSSATSPQMYSLSQDIIDEMTKKIISSQPSGDLEIKYWIVRYPACINVICSKLTPLVKPVTRALLKPDITLFLTQYKYWYSTRCQYWHSTHCQYWHPTQYN